MAIDLDPPAKYEALDLLKQEVTQYGSNEARAFYSFNPSLNLVDVLSALEEPEAYESLQAVIDKYQTTLTIEDLLELPLEQQTQLIQLTETAQAFYQENADQMRSAINPTSMKADDFGGVSRNFQAPA